MSDTFWFNPDTMKRTYETLPSIYDADLVDAANEGKESKLPTPIELTDADLAPFMVEVQGHKFYEFGYIVCPEC